MSQLDDVLGDIRRRVEERRAAGDYPPDLEDRLNAHLARHPDDGGEAAGLTALRETLDRVATARRFDPERISTASSTRAGAAAQRALALAQTRQTSGIFAQVGEFAEQIEAALRLILEQLEAPQPATLLAAQVDALWDRITQLDRPGDAPAELAGLRQRVEALEAGARRRADVTARDTVRWVELVDGPFDRVVALREALAARLAGPVLDLACRRGELLWALRDRAVEARGVDADRRLAAAAAGAGLAAAHAGPMITLARADDSTLGGIAALGVVGRLGHQGAADLVALAAEKLRAGGKLVVENAEPDTPEAWADPTAGIPLSAEWVAFACREAHLAVEVTPAAAQPRGARPGHYLVVATR